MDDYDWLYDDQTHWSEWSHHPNSRLNHANAFDIEAQGWVVSQPFYRLGGIAGYQQTRFSWTALGGLYQYDNDEHYSRQLTFRDEGNDGRYYSVLVDIGYYLASCAKVFTALSWNKYDESRGGTQIIDQISGEQEYIGGHAAGIANEYYRVTAGLTYHF